MTGLIIHLLNEVHHRVHFIHPTTYLKERERVTFKRYWQLQSLEERVIFHVGLDELEKADVGERDILLFDESDDFLFEEPERFLKVIGSSSCVCFTATPGGDYSIEADVL